MGLLESEWMSYKCCILTISVQVRCPDKRVYAHSDQLRRSGIGKIERARSRTLKMTIVIGKQLFI